METKINLIEAIENKIEKLESENKGMREMLKSKQYSIVEIEGKGHLFCIWCGEFQVNGCLPNCELARILGGQER